MKLYHGTNEEAKKEILLNGFFTDYVFLTPDKNAAEDYGDEIIEVYVDEDNLLIDFDYEGKGVEVSFANEITCQPDWTIKDYINANYSVCAKKEFIKL